MSTKSLQWKHIGPVMVSSGIPMAVYVLTLVALLSGYWFLTKSDAGIFRIGFLGQWLMMITIGATGITEQHEQKNGGYTFMRLLPLHNAEIVTAKLINVLLSAGFILGIQFFLLGRTDASHDLLALGRVIILISALTALILVALFYMLIYRFGLARFVKAAWLLVITVVTGPILVTELIILPSEIDLTGLHQTLIGIHPGTWILATLLTLTAFILLGNAAIHVKTAADGMDRSG